jgi:hypothetical protein
LTIGKQIIIENILNTNSMKTTDTPCLSQKKHVITSKLSFEIIIQLKQKKRANLKNTVYHVKPYLTLETRVVFVTSQFPKH